MEDRTYLVELFKFVPSMIVSTTATNAESAWAAGTYALGAKVLHEIVQIKGYMKGLPMLRVFESLVAANTATPGEDAAKWKDIGPANTVAMFDGKISSQTSVAGTLTVRIAPASNATVVVLFGLVGQSATVTARNAADEVEYTASMELVAEDVLDWFQYYTAPFEQMTRTVFTGVPVYTSSTLEISITPRGGVASIGQVCMGMPRDIGFKPLSGATVGADDYSVKDTDEFGDTELVERPSSDFQNIAVLVEKERLGSVLRLLKRIRATPCVLLGSSSPELAEALVNYGWVGSHTTAINHVRHSLIDIEFKGLT